MRLVCGVSIHALGKAKRTSAQWPRPWTFPRHPCCWTRRPLPPLLSPPPWHSTPWQRARARWPCLEEKGPSTPVYICSYLLIYTHTHTHTHIIYINMYVFMYICGHMYLHMYVYIFIHIYTYYGKGIIFRQRSARKNEKRG